MTKCPAHKWFVIKITVMNREKIASQMLRRRQCIWDRETRLSVGVRDQATKVGLCPPQPHRIQLALKWGVVNNPLRWGAVPHTAPGFFRV